MRRRAQVHVPDDVAAPLEQLLRIGELRSFEEAKCHPPWHECQRENRFRRPIIGTIPEHERVVIVIDELDAAGNPLAHFRPRSFARRHHLRRVLRQKACYPRLGPASVDLCGASFPRRCLPDRHGSTPPMLVRYLVPGTGSRVPGTWTLTGFFTQTVDRSATLCSRTAAGGL